MRVLITDGDTRAALAIVRSLGRKGYIIHVGAEKHPSLASSSTYCSNRFEYTNPKTDNQGFIGDLIKYVRNNKIDILLPVTDITTITTTCNRNRIEKSCHIPFSDAGSILRAADKAETIQMARALGLPVPETRIIHTKEAFQDLQENDFNYPLVIKPSRSRILIDNRWHATAVEYAQNKSDLTERLLNRPEYHYPMLLQERIKGPGIGIFLCFNKGQLIGLFSHRRLREKPPSGGVSTLRESIPYSEKAREYAQKLLENLNWHGVAMVEFKQDERDGELKLMEINGRFWGSLQLAIDAGVDFPGILMDTVSGNPQSNSFEYNYGIKTRWLLGDLDALLMVLLKKREALNLPADFGSKLRYLLQFLRFFQSGMHYEVARLSDIKPFIYELKNWIKRDVNA